MKTIKARIPVGRSVHIQEIEVFTIDEAKDILRNREWEPGGDVFDVKETNKRIAWLAEFPDGSGIYVEVKRP